MITIPFLLTNADPCARENEVLQFGVPCAKGLLWEPGELTLAAEQEAQAMPASARVTARWPDGSVKWLLVVSRVSMPAHSQRRWQVRIGQGVPVAAPEVQSSDARIRIDTAGVSVLFEPEGAFPFSVQSPLSLQAVTRLVLAGGGEARARVDTQSVDRSLAPMRLDVVQEGSFEGSGLRFLSTVSWFGQSGLACWEFTLWNPAAASHPGGCWDLGDPASILIESLITTFSGGPFRQAGWKLLPEHAWTQGSVFELYQESSGGEHWQSLAHVNRDNQVPDRRRGYRMSTDAGVTEGLRATPFVALCTESGGLQIHLQDFWQNFPKALSCNGQAGLSVAFFPAGSADQHELQPGERKTHRVWLDLSGQANLAWAAEPMVPTFDLRWWRESGVIGDLLQHPDLDPLRNLLVESLDGRHNFFAKRERIDEYGWRHFGEVYADHETRYQKAGEAPLVSHYNNQYDAVMGFARQFMQTGDARWFILMDELARHVTDIDLYHTEQDKVEYNGGLFWHTDHYLPAHTCTHRTFTRYSTTSSTPGQTGGGPGSEHCYATGLLWHHYLTGNLRSRDAVLQLATWMWRAQDGAETFLAQLWAAKKIELSKIVSRLKGRSVLPYRYPFTRGTGNYVVTLLDAFELSGDRRWLDRAEAVIRQTAHPADNIAQRHLDDIENTWSYVVFLQSLLKYLACKESMPELDRCYHYARQTLRHYALWMLAHEQPYRAREETLEFPNDTWVAQEIRKATLLAQCSRYVPARRDALLARAHEFLDYLIERLGTSDERHYARVQIVLLQSYGAHAPCLAGEEVRPLPEGALNDQEFGSAPRLSILKTGLSMLLRILRGLKYLSPAKELAWLRNR
jgi:hypothetical protein